VATKSNKHIDKHIVDTFEFKKECLRRNPNFFSDLKNYWQSVKQEPSGHFKFLQNFVKKYGFIPPKKESLSQPDFMRDSRYCNIISVVSADKIIRDKMEQGESPVEELEARCKLALSEHKSLNPLMTILEDDRFLVLKIDTDRDEEIIKRVFVKELKEIKNMKKKYKIGSSYDKTPHLDKTKRYFKVFDLRAKKPPQSYERIALSLIKEGFFKNKSLEQAIASAKKDFSVAFKGIYSIPYKKFNKKEFNKTDFKGCKDCLKRSVCKESCAEMEYILCQQEVKQAHFIGKEDVSEWDNN